MLLDVKAHVMPRAYVYIFLFTFLQIPVKANPVPSFHLDDPTLGAVPIECLDVDQGELCHQSHARCLSASRRCLTFGKFLVTDTQGQKVEKSLGKKVFVVVVGVIV